MGYLNDLQFGEYAERAKKEELERRNKNLELMERYRRKRLNQRDRQRNLRGLPDKDRELVELKKKVERLRDRNLKLNMKIRELEKALNYKQSKLDIPEEIKEESIETIEI